MADIPAIDLVEDATALPAEDVAAEDILTDDVLVEEVSIDGMCGVY